MNEQNLLGGKMMDAIQFKGKVWVAEEDMRRAIEAALETNKERNARIAELEAEVKRLSERGEATRSGPVWDGWIRFDTDCIVNGFEFKAGTSIGPFKNAAPQGSPVVPDETEAPAVAATARWSCGWLAESNRCLRLGCSKVGPCEGVPKATSRGTSARSDFDEAACKEACRKIECEHANACKEAVMLRTRPTT